ncbi:MAG TPA: leucine-rich repeat domain-containing protein [Flavobacterium sp.]|uniref:leucine-rich repeat domain-containing protein n=1 Tax=Flavobacterium sp. TaxID=239 RepID=UPI002ED54591
MSVERNIRINKVLRELNISLKEAINFLVKNNVIIDKNPSVKISNKEYLMLKRHFGKPQLVLKLEKDMDIFINIKEDGYEDGLVNNELKNYFSVNEKNELVELNLRIPPFYFDPISIDEYKQRHEYVSDLLSREVNLEILYLRDNNFIDYSFLENLSNLKFLDLSHNDIEDISFLKKLTQLNHLNLSYNKIEDITHLTELKELITLNLANNFIVNISALKNLINLRELDLSTNFIHSIEALSKFKNFVLLNLASNEISDIFPLKDIRIEMELLLGYNDITDLSPLYNSVKQGYILDLDPYDNPLQYPPMDIVEKKGELEMWDWFEGSLDLARERIRNVKNNILDLGNLGLTDLSLLPELFQLENLEELILSNHYAEFKDGFWNNVRSDNNHYPNNISHIPLDVKKLKNLKKLIIGGDWRKEKQWNRWRLKSIANIFNLTSLEILNVSNNKITSIKGVTKLVNLKVFHANNNYIKTIDNLGRFESLHGLYLSNNEINKADFFKDLASLQALDLHANLIKDLAPITELIERIGISDDKWRVDTICISKNKLVNPGIEVVRNGTQAVLNQIKENNLSELFINDEIKLILIGNSEAGKSTFASYLQGNRDFAIKLPYTLWMDEINILIDKTKVRVFDFGGHDYFHDTHHIFFTNNTVYLLLWDNLNNAYKSRLIDQVDKNDILVSNETQDYPLKYWLESVKHFIKDKNATNFKFGEDYKEIQTYSSDVLVVQNKVSKNREIVHLNNELFKEKYPFIYDFSNIDIYTNRNMGYVTSLLKEMIANFVGVKYPVYYKKIRESLQLYNENRQKPVVTIEEFLDYCKQISKEDLNLDFARNIANYLDSIGVIVLNKSEDLLYLNKNLLSEGVLKVFLDLKSKKGEFNIQYAEELLGNNTEHILRFMIDFKMIFRIEKANSILYVAPLYLPSNPSKLIDLLIDDNKLPSRRFLYTGFIHKNVVLDIFSKYSDKIKEDDYKNTYYWKNGLIIKENNGLVLIKFFNGTNNGGAFIDIIKLNNHVDEDFFQTVIKYIRDVNKDYEPLEMVTSNGLDFVPLKDILENEEQKNAVFKYDNKYYRLIDFKSYLKNKNYMKKLFISYSNEDHHWKDMLVKNLKPLTQFQLLKPWSCEDMTSGNWNDQIQKELKEADIVVFMMSLNFVTSDYILKEEVFKTFEEIKNNPDKKVICVLVKNFAWQSFSTFRKLTNLSDSDFEKLQDANTLTELTSKQFIPYCIDNQGQPNERRYLKPLNKWEFEEDAYIEVIRNITSNL